MITLLSIPPSPALSRNPVRYRMRAVDGDGMPYGAKGSTATLQFTNNAFQAGETVTLSYVDEDGLTTAITFTAAADPASINQVQAHTVGLTQEGVEAIADKIQAHYRIGPFLTLMIEPVSVSTYKIIATARHATRDWEVDWDDSGLSGTTSVTTSANQADTTPDNYKVLFDIFFEDTYEQGNFVQVASLTATPDGASEMTLDLQRVLDRECLYSLATPPLPAVGNTGYLRADNLRRFYIRYREQYDDITDLAKAWNHLGTALVQHAGVSQEVFAASPDFLANVTKDTSFLTYYPDRKVLGVEQEDYLPWYNYTGSTITTVGPEDLVRLNITEYDEDNTSSTSTKALGSLEIDADECLLIPAGPAQLGIDAATVKYTVQLVRVVTQPGLDPAIAELSPLRTFYVDRDYYDAQRTLFYLNSFGLPCSLRCLGELTEEAQIDRRSAQRILDDYSANTRELYQYDRDYTALYTYRTGHLRKSEAIALQDMLVENMAYEQGSNAYYSLQILTNTFQITETRQQLHQVTFQARRSLREINFSGAQAMQTADIGSWLLEDESGSWQLENQSALWGVIPS